MAARLAPPAGASGGTALVASGVLDFGSAGNYGSLSGRAVDPPVVAMAATPAGKGYWLVSAGGEVFSYGDAHPYGSVAGTGLNQPIVAIAATPDGKGYWLVATDGGIFTFGDARYYGSTGDLRLNQPIVGMASTRDGRGYWLVASDGGIFTFGDARYYGSTGNIRLNEPVVGMTATPDGLGYRLVAADGGIFTLGDARFYGSTGNLRLNQPIVGMASTRGGRGYWLVASDGGVFTFGDAVYYGSGASHALPLPAIGIVPVPGGAGYWVAEGERGIDIAPGLGDEVRGALAGRAGDISAAVLDLRTGGLYEYNPAALGITASIVKVEILQTLMHDAESQGRGLTPTERSLAASMIEQSDNDSATLLWDEVGGAPAVGAYDESIGMDHTTPNEAWGETTTTALDQITLLEHLVLTNQALSGSWRNYALSLMESVTPSQAWGVSAGVTSGTSVALKNGWLPTGSLWTVNSIGWVNGSGRDYLIAVLTDGDPNESYGISSISTVAEQAWEALGPT